jgi:sugar (pentulose or hexulose) kinase
MLASLAVGFYKSTDDAIKNMVKIKDIYYPDPEINSIYKEKYEVYKGIYSAIRSIGRPSISFEDTPENCR